MRELLIAIGEDPDREGLRETPARVARAYAEIFHGLYEDPDEVLDRTFDEHHQELILVKDIPMFSTCEHHLVPFHGVAHVGYIPGEDGRLTGLWRVKLKGGKAELTVETLGRIPRADLEEEAQRVAELRGAAEAAVVLA